MKNKENQSIININVLKGIPKGSPLWSFFWKEWEYETNCETRSNLRFIEKNGFLSLIYFTSFTKLTPPKVLGKTVIIIS